MSIGYIFFVVRGHLEYDRGLELMCGFFLCLIIDILLFGNILRSMFS